MTYPTSDLPLHLQQYVAKQDYDLYTPIDQASWRYIMRVSTEFFKDHAHPKYLDGLIKTGVTIESIPRITEMDRKLQKVGWRAIIVTGFIPPEPFLELLAHRVLPIACDMRKLENIDYTPAPDIVHEAAGHAPILADSDYSNYLMKFGEIARRVIFAKEDNLLYEAILNLSETKEDPSATPEQIEKAQVNLDTAVAAVGYVSEAQQLTRLGWWTTEYGLFKDGNQLLIYGAGLLSSVGESFNCISDSVKKVPLTIECLDTPYDITKPQPQLFYTDDFRKLEKVIDELSERMAYRRGGQEGLLKAKKAQTVTTTVFETGLQVSGILQSFLTQSNGSLKFLKWDGPVQLSLDEIEISGHDAHYHGQGFGSPIGRVKGLDMDPSAASMDDWQKLGCEFNERCEFEFESGIRVEGIWTGWTHHNGHAVLMTFEDCTVKDSSEILFMPQWGTFDMALGTKVVSVFGGAADRNAYAKVVQRKVYVPRPQKSNYVEGQKDLCRLYQKVRELRETSSSSSLLEKELAAVKADLDKKYPGDWLLRIEILELIAKYELPQSLQKSLMEDLMILSQTSKKYNMLITRGISLIKTKESKIFAS